MKKWMILLLALMLPLGALAETAVYGTGVQLTFAQPENTVLLTRESDAEEFAAQGLDQQLELSAMARERRSGALYWTEHPGTVTFLYAWFDAQEELNDRSSRAMRREIRQELMDLGYTVEDSAYLKKQGLNALRVAGWKDLGGANEYVVEYDLWQNGCRLRFRTLGEGKAPDAALLTALDGLVRSAACEVGSYGVGTDELEDGTFVVTLPGAAFSFMPPAGCVCITRESSASVFNRAGLSQREQVPQMVEDQVYAYLLDERGLFELHILAYPFVSQPYDDVPEVDEFLLADEVRREYREMGAQVTSATVYRADGGHKYVCIEYHKGEGTDAFHAVEYLTCRDGYAVNAVVLPYWGKADAQQLAFAETLLNSLHIQAK